MVCMYQGMYRHGVAKKVLESWAKRWYNLFISLGNFANRCGNLQYGDIDMDWCTKGNFSHVSILVPSERLFIRWFLPHWLLSFGWNLKLTIANIQSIWFEIFFLQSKNLEDNRPMEIGISLLSLLFFSRACRLSKKTQWYWRHFKLTAQTRGGGGEGWKS